MNRQTAIYVSNNISVKRKKGDNHFCLIVRRNEGVSLPVTIGNIPHKIAFPTFDDKGDEFQRLPDNWIKKYPSIPAHSGNKYISYKMK